VSRRRFTTPGRVSGEGRASSRPCRHRGSTLILAMWVLFFLAALGLAISVHVSSSLDLARALTARQRARGLAVAAVERGVFAAQTDTNGWDALVEPWAGWSEAWLQDEGVSWVQREPVVGEPPARFGLVDEERLISVNRAPAEALRAIFELAGGMDGGAAAELAAAVVDWRDADNAVSLVGKAAGGAEGDYYHGRSPAYDCANREFGSLCELLLVRGVTPELYRKVAPYLTVHGAGRVNLNTAEALVLAATGMAAGADRATAASLAEKLVKARAGGLIFETQDPRRWAGEVLRRAALTPPEQSLLMDGSGMAIYLDVKSTCFGGVAVGRTAASNGGGGEPETQVIEFVFDRRLNRMVSWYEH